MIFGDVSIHSKLRNADDKAKSPQIYRQNYLYSLNFEFEIEKKTVATNIEWIDVIVSTDDKIVKQKTAK